MNETLNDSGRLLDRQSMVWMRHIDAPIERVWDMVSTSEGLSKWFLAGQSQPREIELRRGGKFKHHWDSIVLDFKKHEYIDFGDESFVGVGMRFELRRDGNGTVFAFMDNWHDEFTAGPAPEGKPWAAAQPGGKGTPPSGVCAGWHAMVDHLEALLTGKAFTHSYEELSKFYAGYLVDCFRWLELMPAKREAEKTRHAAKSG